jgi:hypothetical protein
MGKFGAVKGPGRAVISARSSREGSAGPGNPGSNHGFGYGFEAVRIRFNCQLNS